jgi:GT2 family glycosyltransferase
MQQSAPRAAGQPTPRISVIVPSYQRPAHLAHCLRALEWQLPAPEVVVSVRSQDSESQVVLARPWRLDLRVARVDRPGLMVAMNAALDLVSGEVTALLDDDTEPWPDWTARIARAFSDPQLVGLGGRDVQRSADGAEMFFRSPSTPVGQVTWFGRHIGNHHLGAGGPRGAQVLKGANSAYRTWALRSLGFDRRMRGNTVLHWELSLGLTLRRSGAKLLYDPQLLVEHRLGRRPGGEARDRPERDYRAQVNFNEALALTEHFAALGPLRSAVFWLYAECVGTRESPGLAQVLRFALRGQPDIYARWAAAAQARWQARALLRAGQRA